MDAVWFVYTTMTGIGYGDLHPNHATAFEVHCYGGGDQQVAVIACGPF